MYNINNSVCLILFLVVSTNGEQSTVELVQDIYKTCLHEFSLSCVKPKTMQWIDRNVGNSVIRITDDLAIKKNIEISNEIETSKQEDALEKFEDFLQTHELVARAPALLHPNGPLGQYIPRNFQTTDLSVPLAATGRSSKLIKRVIFPFLLGLKFKTAVIIPLALALISLKTWKALTLGLLSLVLTGAIAIFSKLMGPQTPAYEVLHYHPHVDHHVGYHHVDVLPAPALPVAHPVYVARNLEGSNMAYSSYLK